MEIFFVATPADLERLCARLQGVTALALDTEFLREKTYYAQFCLIQLATDDLIACVDPLALSDLSPLLSIIYDRRVTKVMHAARQDMEIFFDLRGVLPGPVFDTQLAAALLGSSDQIGLAPLVEQMTGVTLDKSHTRTDWSQRPLSPQQLEYAADDVRYLLGMYRRQLLALHDKGRDHWLDEDFAALCDTATYVTPREQIWKRIKGADLLTGVQWAVLQDLAAWREDTAIKRNRPRRWILKDEVMVDLARYMPADHAALANIRGLEDKTLTRHGDDLLACIAHAKSRSPELWPVVERRQRLEPEAEALVEALKRIVRERAEHYAIASSMLATRKDLEYIARQGVTAASPLFHGWRREVVGQAVLDFVSTVPRGAVTPLPA